MRIEIDPSHGIRTWASGLEAVRASAGILDTHIKYQAKIKFGLYALAGLLVVIAALIVVFSPNGREGVASIVSVALLIVAAGCAGFSTFAIKTPFLTANAGSNLSPDRSETSQAETSQAERN